MQRIELKEFQIESYENRKIKELSKGNQQKIQFISAVLHHPKLLILDEPFTGLDPINVELMKKAIFKLQKEGCSIIFSSHQMEHIENFCEKLIKFQIECVNKLLDATTVGLKKEVLVQAPTGSGKTIILLEYIQEYVEENKNTIFVWLTPGKGDLEEQSREKMTQYLPNMISKNITEVLLSGFEAGDTAFINWETITKKGNTALKDAERKNLFERIDEAYNRGYNFIVIVDEEHLNKTVKAEAIIDYLKPNYIIRVSATTKKNKEAEFIQIDEMDVINEGLITRALYINENVGNNVELKNEHEYLIDLALDKQKAIRKEYKKINVSVNPLIIIQVPNNSDELIIQIEKILDNRGYSYKNKSVAIWLADKKENIEGISENNAEPIILIMI